MATATIQVRNREYDLVDPAIAKTMSYCGGSAPIISSQLCWLLVLIIVSFVRTPSLFGQTPPSPNLQVGHESWTFKDGAPPDVACLAQANDGFLWLCAPDGLVRFDGTRFEPFRSPFGDRLLSANVYSLFAPRSGGLWVGYQLGGFSFLDNGRVTNYASETGSVYGFAQDRDGIVWAAASSGLWRFDHSDWQHIGSDWNAPARRVPQVGFDSEGILWVLAGGHDGPMDLIYLLPGTRHFKQGKKNLSVQGFTLDADRTVITHAETPQMSDSGQGADKKPAAYPVLAAKDTVQLVDRNNGIWISGADKPVVMRFPKERLHDWNNEAFARSSETYDVNFFELAKLVDREGNIWFGDTKGIHRFFYTSLIRQEFPKEVSESADFAVVADDNGAVWVTRGGDVRNADLYYVRGGKAERRVPQVTSSFAYRAPDKTFWFSGKRSLWHLVGRDFIRVDLPREVADQFGFLQAITQDQHGGIWVSFGRHGLYRWANGNWTPYGGRNDFPRTGNLLIEFTDSLGRVWFGYSKSQLAVLDGDRVRRFGPSDDLQVGNITAIYGRGSKIWIGGEFGLEQFDQGRFHKIAAVDDELLHGISGIVETPDGDLWLNGISGIFHIRKAQISEALKVSAYRVKGEHFGRREGLPGVASQVRPLPTAIEGTDGRLWFTLRNGAVWLDSAAYSQKQTVPPPITIQSVTADDKFYAPAPGLSLPAHTSSVQISYSAVSLSDPEAIRFRYRLRETDNAWHEVAASSPVTYRNLPPGSYHFNVAASDTNGVWSDKIATAEFTILPTFYQTLWFRSLCVILFLATLAGLYQLRLRRLARQYGMRERLLQLEADLAHINRVSMMGEMAASLAHEIKQPIAAAITSASTCIRWLAQEPPNLDKARTAASRVEKDSTRAAEIIDRLRSLYKKTPPQRELVDVNEIIREMLGMLRGEITQHSIALRSDLASDLPHIMADRVQLQQVFMNLVLNAIEAMEDGGGELTVKSERQDGQPVFSVSDTGIGLPPEKMNEIFSAFFTTKPQGSGMGLAISRSIIESHGGRLWATANSGHGAIFHFTLPIGVQQ